MKKIYMFIIFTAIIISVNMCKTLSEENIPVSDLPEIDGWYNDDSCRVTGKGSPDHRVQSVILKRVAALDNAVINARQLMLEFLVQTYLKHNAEHDYETVKEAYTRSYSELINTGIIVQENYSGDDSCTIIFVITKKNLKREILNGTALK